MKTGHNNSGATLVELMVAATIMVVILFAVLSVVRVGSEIEVDDNHRRVARSLLISWFEKNFSADAYDTITTPQSITRTDTVDNRDGSPIIATFTATIADSIVEVNGSDIPVKAATAKLRWEEFEGVSDSLSFTKWIANIQ